MPAQYHLSCACGQKHVVSAAQAGQTLACTCGAPLDVPTLRGLNALEPATPERALPAQPTWGPRQGVMLLAAALAVVALLAAGWLRNQARPAVSLTTAEAHQMDELTPVDSLQWWRALSTQGLQMGFDSASMEQAHFAGLWIYVALGVAALALAVVAIAAATPLVFGRPATKPGRPRPGR